MRIFSHPDFTVGPGITPDRRIAAFADCQISIKKILSFTGGSFTETLHIEIKAIQNSIPLVSIFDFQQNLSLLI